MKRKFLFLTSVLFIGMVFFSCNGNKQGGGGDEGGNDNPDNVYYNVLADNKIPAIDVVNLIFSNMEENMQTTFMKAAIMSKLNEFTAQIEDEMNVSDIELGFRKVAYSYNTIGVDGEPLELSSVALWRVYREKNDDTWHDISPDKIALVEHYTITSDAESPTQGFPFELLVTGNTLSLMPDYIGYGVTADKVHPYLVMELTARNVLDMYDAVVPFLEKAGCAPEHDDIYLMGYSQGGATTMAVLHEIEHNEIPIKIRRVFAGGGPYDIKYTYDQFVETNWASYPCAVPIMMQGMVVGNKLDLDMSTMMASNIYENLDEWVNSKLYTSNQINALIGTNVTSNLLTPIGMDRTSKEVSELYKAMTENSILTYSWTPKAPVFIFHSMDDDVVPFENAMRAKSKWKNANIQYSFGHYGTHQLGCVRFIYTVQTLLQNDEKEENGNFSF